MALRPIGAALLCVSLLLAGCALDVLDRTPGKIAALRKAGDLSAAKATAVEAVTDSPKKMAVWRELAATDVALSKNATQTDGDPWPTLVEAALICAGMYDHQKGTLDHDWDMVGMLAAAAVRKQAEHVLNGLDVREVGRIDYKEPDPVSNERDDPDLDPQDPPHRSDLTTTQMYIDPATMADVVRQSVILEEFLKHLPNDNPKLLALTLNQFDQKLLWATAQSNISKTFINQRREAAQEIVARDLERVACDLEVSGHFQMATILTNQVLQ